MNVLIVDDEREFGNFLKTRLSREAPDFSIAVVTSGVECLEFIRSRPVDCILSDYQMPGMNGMELLINLRNQDNDTPFIFLTGQGNEEVAREAFKKGAHDYFAKDIGFAHFTRIINSIVQAVNRRAAEAERRRAEDALRRSEQRVRQKLQNILSPEGDTGKLELADIIDATSIQSLMDNFYELSGIPVGIIDLKGKVLVGVGWQDICTKFHRVHPVACMHCIESDIQLSAGVPPGEFKLYKCKNNMWDIATPIMVGGRHAGNIFMGQFFFEGEPLDYELFRSQAGQYGFDEEKYIAALEAVPRMSRETVDAGMAFFTKLAHMLSQLSYSNIKLGRSLAERDALTDALRESEERLRTLFDTADDGIFLQDEGVFVDCNTKGMELYGCNDKSEIIGHHPMEFAPPFQPDGMDSKLKAMHYINAALDGSPQKFYWQTYRKDGSLLDVEVSLNTLSLKGKTYVQAIVRDNTERKKVEEALRESEERFRTLFESANDGIAIADGPVIVDCNTKIAQMYGYEKSSDIIGHTPLEFAVSPQPDGSLPEEVVPRLVGAALSGVPQKIEWRNRRRDGSLMDVEVSLNPIVLKGKTYIQAMVRDITERKSLESQREHLLELLRHDMKTPLTVIMGNAELALSENYSSLSEDVVKSLQSIHAGSKLLSKMLEDQVIILNIESGGIKTRKEEADIGDMLSEVSMSITGLARKKGLTFEEEIAEGLPRLLIDRLYVLRAVTNLAQNAVNYTPAGGNIKLSAWSSACGGEECVYISMSDNGPGIPAAEQEKVFEKYHRSASARGVNGSGLGLAIVKAVAEAHGGRVELDSEPGRGSSFRLVLPVRPMPAS